MDPPIPIVPETIATGAVDVAIVDTDIPAIVHPAHVTFLTKDKAYMFMILS